MFAGAPQIRSICGAPLWPLSQGNHLQDHPDSRPTHEIINAHVSCPLKIGILPHLAEVSDFCKACFWISCTDPKTPCLSIGPPRRLWPSEWRSPNPDRASNGHQKWGNQGCKIPSPSLKNQSPPLCYTILRRGCGFKQKAVQPHDNQALKKNQRVGPRLGRPEGCGYLPLWGISGVVTHKPSLSDLIGERILCCHVWCHPNKRDIFFIHDPLPVNT